MLRSLRSSVMVSALIFAMVGLVGCGSSPPANSASILADKVAPSTIDAAAPAAKLESSLHAFVQSDLAAAAAYATKNGYPARAAVYQAIAAQGAAIAGQVQACKAAIDAAMPSISSSSPPAGAFTAFEMAAESVATGIPASVRVNCEPIVLPGGVGRSLLRL